MARACQAVCLTFAGRHRPQKTLAAFIWSAGAWRQWGLKPDPSWTLACVAASLGRIPGWKSRFSIYTGTQYVSQLSNWKFMGLLKTFSEWQSGFKVSLQWLHPWTSLTMPGITCFSPWLRIKATTRVLQFCCRLPALEAKTSSFRCLMSGPQSFREHHLWYADDSAPPLIYRIIKLHPSAVSMLLLLSNYVKKKN